MRLLISGATRGLGLHLTIAYAAAGHHVYAGTRSGSATPTATMATGSIDWVPLDVTDRDSIAAAVAIAASGGPLDVLVNNAGTYAPDGSGYDPGNPSQGLGALDADSALTEYATNSVAPLLLTQAALPSLVGRGRSAGPLVANVSSKVGSIGGSSTGGDYYYAPSKAALNMVTRRMAADLHGRVTVVALDPGWLQTRAGGPAAPTPADVGASQVVALLDRMTFADTGRFVDIGGNDIPF